MTDRNDKTDPNATAAYEAMNASYRMMDEYMRQGQKMAEQFWGPWMRNFSGSSPFIPPEQLIRSYGDMAMLWMSMARSWTEGMTGMARPTGPVGGGNKASDTKSETEPPT